MPKWAEQMLAKTANKKGLKGERKNAYIYGTLRHKFNWKPKREK